MKKLFRSVLPFVWILAWSLAVRPALADTSPGGAIDTSVCAGCHEANVAGAFKVTAHAKLELACASCHGEVATLEKHAEAADPDLIKSPKEMTAREINTVCLGCHEVSHHPNWNGSKHERRGLACTTCHSVHAFKSTKAQLKTTSLSETCYGCHKDIRAMTMRQSHHPIREGKVDCGDCHNPHGTITDRMVSANSVNELCYKCHTEKRGPFLWEHAPVRENCLNCHNPHGSNHEKLLVMKQPYLCQRCHLNTRHPGTLYDNRNSSATLPTGGNRAVEHACRNCHQNIHGTNHPSGPYFGR